MYKLIPVLLLWLVGVTTTVNAQTSKADPNDFGTWYSAGVGVKLPKKWGVEAEYEARFQNNAKDFKGSYISISPYKGIGKHFSVLTEYRIALLPDAVYHRYSIGGEYKWKWPKFQLAARVLLQNQVQDFVDAAEATDTDAYFRFRVKGQLGINNKLSAYLSVEPISRLNASYLIDSWRNQAGIKYKLNKVVNAELFYIYRPDYAKSYNRVFQVAGISLNFDLKWKK